MTILEFDGVSKRFGGVQAVDGFSHRLDEGGLYAIIGPNGAGKTTIFNLVTGIYRPSSGRILFKGEDITGLPTHRIARLGIARTFQNIRLFPHATVLDNVRTACFRVSTYTVLEGLVPTPRRIRQEREIKKKAMDLLEMVGLAGRAEEKARNLPYGFQRRVEIARALAQDPSLLLLDEPAAGMNPDETRQLMAFIDRVHRDFKLTILLIEHHMELVMGLSQHIVVLNFGRTLASGSAQEIQNDPAVIEAYLGSEED